MLLWIVIGFLTLSVVVAIARPLTRQIDHGSTDEPAQSDAAVYREQLAALEREVDSGLIGAEEAGSARTEIARRLLKASEATDEVPKASPGASGTHRAAGYAVAASISVIAIGMYAVLGSPTLPDRPHAERAAEGVEGQSIESLVARVEQQLRQTPDDGRGWSVIAPIYMRLGRFDDAATAYRESSRLLGETPDRRIGLAEALVFRNNGVVTDTAEQIFTALRAEDPARPEPAFWLAVRDQQDGKVAEARAAFQELLARAPADAPWVGVVRDRLAGLGGLAEAPGERRAGGPTPEDVETARAMSANDRNAMIRDMVDGLDARLTEGGGTLEEWVRLIRARLVLGESDAAEAAFERARNALADDPNALAQLEQIRSTLSATTVGEAPARTGETQ